MNIKNIFFLSLLFAFLMLFVVNIKGFYENMECDAYLSLADNALESAEIFQQYKLISNKLFKIWMGLDFLQTIQSAVPEGEPIHYWILNDAITVLNKIQLLDNDHFKNYKKYNNALKIIIIELLNNNVVEHLKPLKIILKMNLSCLDSLIMKAEEPNLKMLS